MAYITIMHCAQGAKAIYKNVDFDDFNLTGGFFDPKNTPQMGWRADKMADGEEDSGGASVGLYKFQGAAKMYMVSFRGSAGKPHKDGKDWTDDDLSIGLGRLPDRTNDAFRYAENIVRQYSDSFVIFVGHSLGGYLAQVIGCLLDKPFITFNAPPALGSWSGKLATGDRVGKFKKGLNFRVNWDPVSKLSGGHVGPLQTLPHQGLNITNAHGNAAVLKAVQASGMGGLPAMGAITAANR